MLYKLIFAEQLKQLHPAFPVYRICKKFVSLRINEISLRILKT